MRKDAMRDRDGTPKSVPKERRHRLRDGVAAILGVSSDAAFSEDGLAVEMRGCGSVTVRGCRRILTYTPTEICLLTRDGGVRVTGEGLACFSYFHGAVGIEGRISGILLEQTRAGRRPGGAEG